MYIEKAHRLILHICSCVYVECNKCVYLSIYLSIHLKIYMYIYVYVYIYICIYCLAIYIHILYRERERER